MKFKLSCKFANLKFERGSKATIDVCAMFYPRGATCGEALTVAVDQENDCLFARHAAENVQSPPTSSAVSGCLLGCAFGVRRNSNVGPQSYVQTGSRAVRSATSTEVLLLTNLLGESLVSEGICKLVFFAASRSVGWSTRQTLVAPAIIRSLLATLCDLPLHCLARKYCIGVRFS